MKLLFVGDGSRDIAVLPALVENLLDVSDGSVRTDSVFKQWRDIELFEGGTGYRRRMQFAIAQARAERIQGLVCAVDCDKAHPRERLKELNNARDADRTKNTSLPTAIGEARPHGEAWLVDDPDAVREGLSLDSNVHVPSYKKIKDPKAELNKLLDAGGATDGAARCAKMILIAEKLDPDRCKNGKATGFNEFVEEVVRELQVLSSELTP
jgi:hypothetical protein